MPYWKEKNPIRPEELTSAVLVYSSFQRNFLGLLDSIMKFLFVLGLDRLLEARFQAWLERSIEFTTPWLAPALQKDPLTTYVTHLLKRPFQSLPLRRLG